MTEFPLYRRWFAVLVLCAAVIAPACGGKDKDIVSKTGGDADKFLFEKGTAALNKRRWYTAREYFSRIVDNYPQSPYRPDAKLGVGDTYLGEGSSESYVLAENEFKEFLQFYPTNQRADYAQYKLGMAHFYQMHKPGRDQSQTRMAVHELETFVVKYPNSSLMPEVQDKLREAKDRVGMSDYQIGYFYYKNRWYPGAIVRFKELLKQDPGFTNRDAVYFYLGEALMKVNQGAEAIPYFDRLVKEFDASEFLEKAKQRIAEYKPSAPAAAPQAPTNSTSVTPASTDSKPIPPGPGEQPAPAPPTPPQR
jgi:outer membrane protein assembly factor BamD